MSENEEKYGQSYSYLGGARQVNEPMPAYGLQARIALIRRGLPLSSLNYFLKHSGLNRQELGAILHISPRTMQRYSEGQMLPPPVSEKLLKLNELYETAEAVLGGGAANVSAWLKQKVAVLGNHRPLDLLYTYEGLQEVIKVLGRIEWAVAT